MIGLTLYTVLIVAVLRIGWKEEGEKYGRPPGEVCNKPSERGAVAGTRVVKTVVVRGGQILDPFCMVGLDFPDEPVWV